MSLAWADIVEEEEEAAFAARNQELVFNAEALCNFEEWLDFSYEITEERTPRLILPEDPVMQRSTFTMREDMRDFIEVIPLESDIVWKINIPDEEERFSTISARYEKETRRSEHHKIRHDLVAEAISNQNTDKKFSEVFPPLGTEDDNWTPDFIFRTGENTFHIVELTTTRSDSENSAIAAYKSKYFKYAKSASDRFHDNIITLNPIVVTPSNVYSSTGLPQRIVNDLVFRMQLSIIIETKLFDMGFSRLTSHDATEQDRMADQIGQVISSIEHEGVDPIPGRLVITDEFRTSCYQNSDLSKVKECYKQSYDRTQNINHLPIPQDDHVRKFKESYQKNSPFRHDMKPVVVMPLIVPQNTHPGTNPKPNVIARGIEADENLAALWDCGLSRLRDNSWIDENLDDLLQEAYDTNPKTISERQEKRKQKRKTYHRVCLASVMDSDMIKYLQKDGIGAKRGKDEEWLKVRKASQKLPFSYNTPTKDISEFLALDLLSQTNEVNAGERDVLSLLKKSNELMGNVRLSLDVVESWMKTDLYRSQDFLTDLATELAISIKQNTKRHDFILKKLRYWDCYLLIKPTNSQSHLFYSLYFPTKPKILCELPFRKLYKTSAGWVTDFCSVRADKLSNFLIAGPRLISMISFWCDFYGISDMSPDGCKDHDLFKQALNLSVLISLENKASTEEVITATRYMYMEFFRSNMGLNLPNPFKALDKFPTIIRSRLTLWCIKNVINNGLLMTSSVPQRIRKTDVIMGLDDETVGPEDGWTGMINLITGEEVSTASQVVNLMYVGYLKDKNESAQENVEWKLVEKIVDEELKISEERLPRYYGKTEPGDAPLGKEFSLDCMIFGCEQMEFRLRQKLGDNWKKLIRDEMLKALSKHLTHEIATLKASSKIQHDNVNLTCTKADTEHTMRVKVIEAIAAKLDKFNLNPMEHLNDFLKYCERTANGVICDLFKKNQHGGLREIYVLTIESRILQLFIETLSRTLCLQFEEETLTHPRNKLAKLDEHKTRSAKISKAKEVPYAEFCSSSDKTRWNQNFTMPAMSVPLFRLCDPIFHNAIQRVMNLWANKLIKLPSGVCKLLLRGDRITSKSYNELYKEFHSGTDKTFKLCRSKNSGYLSPTSGMMQGILHYTSSLVHLVFLHAAKKITLDILKNTQGKMGMFHLMSFVVSSDDSSVILTVFCPKEGNMSIVNKAREILKIERHLHTLSYFCSYFNMKESVKSTVGLLDYVEYNSEFLMKNTIAAPTIKFVTASLILSESESFIMRFHEQYNLISALYSQGFPSLNTHLVQIAQAILHYKTLGSASSMVFHHYTAEILEYPDPVHGFFLLDEELACGLAGFSYSRWKAVKNDKSLFASLKIIKRAETEVGPDGTIVDSLNMKHGDNYRWYKMLDRISQGQLLTHSTSMKYNPVTGEKKVDLELARKRIEEINSIPELFFTHPTNKDQVKIKLLMKATMPGVAKSLSRGNPILQSFSSTAYSLYSHCFTRTTLHKDATTVEKQVQKYSILSSLHERKTYIKEWELEVDEVPMEMIFPLVSRYQEIEEVADSYKNCELLKIGRLRQRKTEIRMDSFSNQLPLTLLQVCRRWWFGHALHVSNSVYQRCRSIYCTTFPWLRSDFSTTLQMSPFSTYHELYGYISSQMARSRTVLRIGPGAYANTFSGKVSLMIKKSPLKNHIFSRPTEKVTRTEDKGVLIANLELALMIPHRATREAHVNRQLTHIKELALDSSKKWTKLETKILAIARFRDGELTQASLSDYLRENRMGLIIQYITEQRRVIDETGRVRWMGAGECIVNDEGVCMRVTLSDDKITKIVTKDWDRLRRNPGILRELFQKLECKPSTLTDNLECVARFDGFHFSDKSQVGTPVVLQRDFFPIKLDLTGTEFRIKHNEVGIYKIEREGRVSQVIAFRCKSRLKRKVVSKHITNGFWNAWTNGSRANIGSVLPFINSLNGRSVSSLTREWCSNSLKRRLTSRGFYGSYLDSLSDTFTMTYNAESVNADDDDDIANWLDEEMELYEREDEIDFGGNLGQVDQDLEEPDVMEEFVEFGEDVTNEVEMIFRTGPDDADEIADYSVVRFKEPECFSSHPVWDEFIDTMVKIDPSFFFKVIDGIVPVAESNIARNLMKLLGIRETKTEKSLEEAFQAELIDDVEEEEESVV
nr:RNA-dependent RNA polymerase [Erthesina fullo bunyavirus 1]